MFDAWLGNLVKSWKGLRSKILGQGGRGSHRFNIGCILRGGYKQSGVLVGHACIA